jgi:fatty-acyl-CoA synthase
MDAGSEPVRHALASGGMGHFGVRELLTKNRHSRVAADSPALVHDGRTWTYRELDEAVTRVASALVSEGFGRGDRLAVLMYNRPEYVVALFAAAHLGGILVPINYYLAPAEIASAIDEAEVGWVLVEDDLAEHLRTALAGRSGVRVVQSGDPARRLDDAVAWSALTAYDGELVPAVSVELTDEALYQFSSGTTGIPKAAIHTHGNVLMNALTQVAEFSITAADVHLVVPALCWGAGFHDYTIATWWQGGTVVLHSSRGLTAKDIHRAICEHHVTTVLLVPSVIRIFLSDPDLDVADLKSLRIILSGGEPVPVESIQTLQQLLPHTQTVQAYGLSEFPVITTFLDGGDALQRRSSAGKATMGAIVRVVDEDGNDVAPGETGEIISKALSSMERYTGSAVDSGTRMVDGWLHTGDRATVDEDGFLYIAGRAKDMIISGGLNVYPAEIERVLDRHPAVVESAVIGVADQKYGETGLAVVVVADDVDHAETERALREELRGALAHFKVPKHWVLTHEPLPRTTSRKVQKFVLREQQAHHLDTCRCLDPIRTTVPAAN